jgi:hypothetical protein
MGDKGCIRLEGSLLHQQQEQCERFLIGRIMGGGRFRFRETSARSRQIFQQFRERDKEWGNGQPPMLRGS